VCL
ncbi:Elongation factor Ts, partial [Haemophilus influenzae]|jgi:hypothetical protein